MSEGTHGAPYVVMSRTLWQNLILDQLGYRDMLKRQLTGHRGCLHSTGCAYVLSVVYILEGDGGGEGEGGGGVADGDGEGAGFYNEVVEVGVVEGECFFVESDGYSLRFAGL